MANPPFEIPLGALIESPTNPRKIFDPKKLAELAETLRQEGLMQSLLVRPTWCQGCKSTAQIEAKRPEGATDGRYEIVDGARRRRAFEIMWSEMEPELRAMQRIPCDVRELTDAKVITIQLLTSLEKEKLTALEEARGFEDLMRQQDEGGEPLNTQESIAKTLGLTKETVSRRLALLSLVGVAREALEDGRLGVHIAGKIARIPLAEDRAKAAEAIIAPKRVGGDIMSSREAEIFIRENFMISLAGAPFDTADEILDPVAGSCAACPHRTGNNPELFGDVQRGDTCTKPSCYRNKCRLAFARATAAVAESDKTVTIEANAEQAGIFSPHDGVSLPVASAYVDYCTKPAESFVNGAVDYTKLPTWEKLCDGHPLPKLLAQDREGRMRTLVKRDVAIAAAIENGEDIFVAGIAAKHTASTAAAPAKSDAEKFADKKSWAVMEASLKALREEIEGHGAILGFEEVLCDLAMEVVGTDALWFVLRLRGVKKELTQTSEQAFEKYRETLREFPKRQWALVFELMAARQLRAAGLKKSEGFQMLADYYQLPLDKIEAAAIAALKPKKNEVVIDGKRLAQWVKLHAGGKTYEQIAALDKVPVADVAGALGGAKPPSRKDAKAQKHWKEKDAAFARGKAVGAKFVKKPMAKNGDGKNAVAAVVSAEIPAIPYVEKKGEICGVSVGKFIAIKTKLAAGKPMSAIAKEFDVSVPRVYMIKNRVEADEASAAALAKKGGKRK